MPSLLPWGIFPSRLETMQARIMLVILVLQVGTLGCSRDPDCRHKSRECAAGFRCQRVESGDWECLPDRPPDANAHPHGEAEEPVPETRPPVDRQTLMDQRKACPRHDQCPQNAVKCTCNGLGWIMTKEIDRDDDGRADERIDLSRDHLGRLIETTVDKGMDGSTDAVHTNSYDQQGNLVALYTKYPAGQSPNVRVKCAYDRQGNLLRMEFDEGIDGKLDKVCTFDPPCPPPIPNPKCRKTCK